MRVLLDTHMMLWALLDSSNLSSNAKSIIEDECNEIFYSVASLWEIQIKHLLHPKDFPSAETVEKYCELSGYNIIRLSSPEIFCLKSLRYREVPEHKDPFDRILISQAKTYGMSLLTSDSKLAGYKEKCVIMGL